MAVNDLCVCGHTLAEHEDQACTAEGCACDNFEEAADV